MWAVHGLQCYSCTRAVIYCFVQQVFDRLQHFLPQRSLDQACLKHFVSWLERDNSPKNSRLWSLKCWKLSTRLAPFGALDHTRAKMQWGLHVRVAIGGKRCLLLKWLVERTEVLSKERFAILHLIGLSTQDFRNLVQWTYHRKTTKHKCAVASLAKTVNLFGFWPTLPRNQKISSDSVSLLALTSLQFSCSLQVIVFRFILLFCSQQIVCDWDKQTFSLVDHDEMSCGTLKSGCEVNDTSCSSFGRLWMIALSVVFYA